MEGHADAAELVKYLESGDVEVFGKFKQVIHENLYAAKDSSLLNYLIDSYVVSRSENLLAIIVGVNDSHCQYLFEKLNDLLRRGMQAEISALFAAIIRQQPSWLYKIVGSQFFTNYLKTLRGDHDVVFLMSGAVIISMLLPCVPSLVAQYLGDILEVFVRMSSVLVYKPAGLPDILTLHLQIGVYILFHRLYAMYPNNFLSYMKSCFGSKGNDPVFRQVIQPMSQFVKLHPGMVLDTLKSETENTKWKMSQPHDILADCQKISLDPLDAVKEATYTVLSQAGLEVPGTLPKKEVVVSTAVTSVAADNGPPLISDRKTFITEPAHLPDEHGKIDSSHTIDFASYLSNQELSLLWSPSFLCGLSTPPSSRTLSPANSAQDILSLNEFVQRPMTPVVDCDKETAVEQLDYCTSTPDESRRKSGGELKKSSQKMYKSPKLSVKSKSEESVENKNKKSQREDAKSELSPELMKYNVDKPRLSPGKKKGKQLLDRSGSSAKSSPKLSRSDKFVSKQTHSAPSTPAIAQKDSFTFRPVQDHSNACSEHLTADHQSRTSAQTGTSTSHENRRTSTAPHGLPSCESPLNESSASIALLRVVKDLHQEALAKFHVSIPQEHELNEHIEKSKLKSPLELLDEFIKCGSNLHSLQLSRIPITSQFDTDWTYFGGATPADEIAILKTQVNLFEVQLQYERYKCDQHVLRNRRLVGKVHKAQAIEDEIDTLRNQILLLESELWEAKIALKQKDDVIRRLEDCHSTSENRKTESLQQYCQEIEVLRGKLDEFADELVSKGCEIVKTTKELKAVQHELFETQSELDHIKPKLEINNAVQARADSLARALVTFQDKYDKVKLQVQHFERHYVGGEESLMELESLRNELRDHRVEREHLLTSLDAAKVRIVDLEASLAKKELLIRDQKSKTEQIYQKHDEQIKILDERYRCLKKATQGMESYILYLFTKLEENGRDVRGHSHGGKRRTERHGRGDRSDGNDRGNRSDHHGHRTCKEWERKHCGGNSKASRREHSEDEKYDKLPRDDDNGSESSKERRTDEDRKSCLSCEMQSSSILDDCNVLNVGEDSSRELRTENKRNNDRTRLQNQDVENEGRVDDSGIEYSDVM